MKSALVALLIALCFITYVMSGAGVSFCGNSAGTKCNTGECERCGAAAAAATLSADDEEVVMTYTTTLSNAEAQSIKKRELNATAIADDEANTLSAQVQLAEGMCRSSCAWIKYVLYSFLFSFSKWKYLCLHDFFVIVFFAAHVNTIAPSADSNGSFIQLQPMATMDSASLLVWFH